MAALTELFRCRFPLIQAPMANAAGGDLAREVARGGGVGMIGTGTRASIPWLESEWAKVGGADPVGIGFMTWALDGDESQRAMLRYALGRKPAAVLLSFGDPRPYAGEIRAAGARLICQVQTAADGMIAREAGADLIVAQGTEAGGHTGHRPAYDLLAEVLQVAWETPVALAGGLADGRDVAEAMRRGAAGAMLGTRFVATPESLYHQRAKERILAAGAEETVLTSLFDRVQSIPWPPQYPGRALRNRFTDQWHGREGELEAALGSVRAEYEAARLAGDYETLVVYAGVASGRVDEILPAAELVARIGGELEQAMEIK